MKLDLYRLSRPHPDRAREGQEYEYAKIEALQSIAQTLEDIRTYLADMKDRLNEAALGGDR